MATDAAAAVHWPDLPLDLLGDILRRLDVVTNYVRFHAVCKPWRDALLPASCRPVFLPWLLSRRDGSGHRKARYVFCSKSSRVAAGSEIDIHDPGWVVSVEDGAAARTTGAGSGSSMELPPYPDAMRLDDRERRPLYDDKIDSCSIAYHDGKIVQCRGRSWTIVPTNVVNVDSQQRFGYLSCVDAGKKFQSGYLVKSRGELLWIFVQVKTNCSFYINVISDLGSLPDAMVMSVYALQCEGDEPRWVERDSQSFTDRVFFLGRHGSFAVDAARFGIGGCAYFVDRRPLYVAVWSKSPLERSRVFKYTFHDEKTELVEQLPAAQWTDVACMWLTPKPAIASTEAATNYLRLHAVCSYWHDSLPPPERRPAFLPWLVAPRDAAGNRKARCVFSSKSSPTLRRRNQDMRPGQEMGGQR
ncbi:hypothetical protein EJB05_28946, partial [Eragrostis curvula]